MLQTSFSLQPVHLPRTYTPMCSQLCAYAHMICRHISISLKLHRSKVKFSCFWVAASEIHMHEHVCLCVYECVCLRLARRPQLPQSALRDTRKYLLFNLEARLLLRKSLIHTYSLLILILAATRWRSCIFIMTVRMANSGRGGLREYLCRQPKFLEQLKFILFQRISLCEFYSFTIF